MNSIMLAAALKVLMVGNSFSVQMAHAMPPIASDMGLELDICSLYIGGCSLKQHWNNAVDSNNAESAPYDLAVNYHGETDCNKTPFASIVKNIPRERNGKKGFSAKINIADALRADAWDIVTIQQASSHSWQPATYHPYGDDLVGFIHRLAPSAKIVVQETWSYTPWDGRFADWNIDQDMMYAALHGAYVRFARSHGLEIIPTGTAVQLVRKELPVIYTENSLGGDVVGSCTFEKRKNKWVPKGDVFHMGPDGNYLQALVWTAKLFNVDVTKCGYAPNGMSVERAAFLREIAMKSIRSSCGLR